MPRLLLATVSGSCRSAPVAIGLFVAAVALVVLCAKQARRVSRKLVVAEAGGVAPKSPKQLLATLRNKATTFRQKKMTGGEADDREEGFGDGGMWRKDILMGEKCQPLDFSGVILYDGDGRRVPEFPPRSPRGSPLPGSFSFQQGAARN